VEHLKVARQADLLPHQQSLGLAENALAYCSKVKITNKKFHNIDPRNKKRLLEK
jgi:hypothetical protein